MTTTAKTKVKKLDSLADQHMSELCTEHCDSTWQCITCGALVHGRRGTEAHQKWHESQDR